MGTPLTGSTVASTYTSILKIEDNTTISGTLKAVSDGAGNNSALQVSTTGVASTGTLAVAGAATITGAATFQSTVNITGATTLGSLAMTGNLSVPGTLSSTGNFAVNTNKFTVDASNGNTAVLGTLGVTGATSLSSLSTSGAATVGTTLGVTGDFAVATNKLTVASASGNTAVAGTLDAAGDFKVATNKFTVAAASGNTAVGGTLNVAGNSTLTGDLSINGNTTVGNASGDSLTVTAGAVTINNLPSKASPLDADTFLLRDSAASNALKTATVASVSQVRFAYSEDIVKTSISGQVSSITSGVGTAIQLSNSTSDWTYTWTPKTVGNKCIIRVSIPSQLSSDGYLYAGIVKSPYATADVIGVGSVYGGNASPVNVSAEAVFTSTASSHTFKIWITVGVSQSVTIAANPNPSYFGNNGSTFQAKVHFELIEFA
jgi:hypothetical protein